ncbi:TIGR02680 family protein [Micromonospora sp. NPDC047548]|uniref:TIGR02680 family protein n=1 Tax=Micromonospora sp. NPDC047548 TaxID=3155624 RepID=UPI0033F91B27
MTTATARPETTGRANPDRFRLHRAGICNVWQYDEQVFQFEDGRLLLRGKNGAGKSKALELLLPFLLDGDAKRLDATGAGRTTFRWLMSEGSTGVNRQGFLWAELRRQGDDGADSFLTLGAVVRWSSSTGEARLLYFVTPLRVGPDVTLVVDRQPLPIDRLRERLGEDAVYSSARDYRARVARELFGITDAGRYRNLVHLLYRLRRPTVGDRIEAGQLTVELSEALPPLDDDVLDTVAHNLDDLEAVREDLGRLERTSAALTDLMTAYRGYLRGELRRRVTTVQTSLVELRTHRRQAGERERDVAAALDAENTTDATARRWEAQVQDTTTELAALRDSAEYRAVRDLGQRRQAVEALQAAARSAERAAAAERRAAADAATRLGEETDRLGRTAAELREGHRRLADAATAAGIDVAHLGEPLTLRFTPAAADGRLSTIDVTSAGADIGRCAQQLRAAAHAITGRRQAAADLRGLLTRATSAAGIAARAEADAELLDAQQETAQNTLAARAEELLAASTAYAGQVLAWLARPALVGADVAALRGAVTANDDVALPADTPATARSAAEAALEPVRRAADARRDDLLRALDRIKATMADLRAEQRRWTEQTDPRPPASRFRSTTPAEDALYRLVDFAGHLTAEQRAGLEAGLEASGLLDGRVTADGSVVAGNGEVLLRPGPPVSGASLDEALQPVPGAERVTPLLAGIALGPAEATSWVGYDGSWRLGVAHGTWHKPTAEYVGAANRAALRARRLAELATRIDQAQREQDSLDGDLTIADETRDELTRTLRDLPDGAPLQAAWARRDEAASALARLTSDVGRARRTARDRRTEATARQREAASAAEAHLLPADPDDLSRVEVRLRMLGEDLPRQRRSTETLPEQLAGYRQKITDHALAVERGETADEEATAAAGRHAEAAQALAVLQDSLGADPADVLAREADADRRLRTAQDSLPTARHRYQQARDHRVRTENLRDEARQRLTEQENATLAAGTALPRVLTLPGVSPALGLPPFTQSEPAGESARERIRHLDELARRLHSTIGAQPQDVGENALHNRYNDVRGRLAGGYDLIWEDRDGVKVIEIADDIGQHPVALAAARLSAELDDKRSAVADRERQAFERFLLGELGDALSRQILAAHHLVAAMNDTLVGVRTSHGLGARLVWTLRADSDADTKAAVDLLRTPLAMRTRDQNDRLREVLARRVEDARRADSSAGYGAHLRTALDYRQWFTFAVKVTDQANPDRERTLSSRTAMSQGEQRVVSYLVLFAAAAAHFSSVGAAHPPAPRLILLDDAFAKVDEPTHGRLLGLLVDLDLDAVLTSERLWGCFPEVPSLGIYECLRDPTQPGVATLHFRWDGSRRNLVAR